MLPFHARTPHCVVLVACHVGAVPLLRALALKTCVIYVVPASKTVHQVVMFLYLVTKRLLLIAALSWMLDLMASSLTLLVWWLCVATVTVLVVHHVGDGSKILLPLLAIWIVILAFLFMPLTRI